MKAFILCLSQGCFSRTQHFYTPEIPLWIYLAEAEYTDTFGSRARTFFVSCTSSALPLEV